VRDAIDTDRRCNTLGLKDGIRGTPMTDTSSPAIVVADVIAPVQTALPFKGLVAVVVGNWLEFYDFLVFTFFAVMIGNAFFPGESEIARLLSALATFGVGFLTRPLGAAIIGAYADRVGRRAALTLTLMLMSLGSGLVGLTPTYAHIGVAAPIILVIARLIQGFSAGGEVGAATTYLLESAPWEKRATMTAWQGHSQQLAVFMGSLVGVVLSATLSKEQLYAWGWRVPFLLGVFIAPVGMYIRRQLPETIARQGTHQSGRTVLIDLLQHHARSLILGVLVICGGTVSTYVFAYMATYAITTLHLSPSVGTTLTLTGSLAQIAGFALGAWLDRFGRKPMLVASRVLFLVIISPAYSLITSPDATAPTIVLVNMALNFVFAVGIGATYALLAEAFPRSVRSSGLGVVYALGVMIFGGTTQFVVAWLIDWTKDPIVPAWYQMAANVAAIVGLMLLMPHPEVRRERAAYVAAKA
jgi:MFS family permease